MVDHDSLRAMIREVIEAEVARARHGNPGAGSAPSTYNARIVADQDLAHFAKDVLKLAEDPDARGRILAGSYPFRVAPADHGAPPALPTRPSRIDEGVVTEATLVRLPKGIKILELGPGVVVTPLARERARALGIQLERRRA